MFGVHSAGEWPGVLAENANTLSLKCFNYPPEIMSRGVNHFSLAHFRLYTLSLLFSSALLAFIPPFHFIPLKSGSFWL